MFPIGKVGLVIDLVVENFWKSAFSTGESLKSAERPWSWSWCALGALIRSYPGRGWRSPCARPIPSTVYKEWPMHSAKQSRAAHVTSRTKDVGRWSVFGRRSVLCCVHLTIASFLSFPTKVCSDCVPSVDRRCDSHKVHSGELETRPRHVQIDTSRRGKPLFHTFYPYF